MGTPDEGTPHSAGHSRWSWLLGLEHCERCGGALRWVEAATTTERRAHPR